MARSVQECVTAIAQHKYPVVAQEFLDPLVSDIATHAGAPELRDLARTLAARTDPVSVRQLNLLAAGLLGVLPGGPGLDPVADPAYQFRVNPYLHLLRRAILACKKFDARATYNKGDPLPDSAREGNAKKFTFYPEFLSGNLGSDLRRRIVAIALAHAGMGHKSADGYSGAAVLTVLLSLGGYFSNLTDILKTHTTCAMTCRAVYQAAGASMIGEARPTRDTNKGMDYSLSIPGAASPAKRTGMNGPHPPEPPLEPGDIFFLMGDRAHPFHRYHAGQTQNASAEHVGIVVERTGGGFVTVEGGAGSGAEVALSKTPKKLELQSNGWTFSDSRAGRSYSAGENEALKNGKLAAGALRTMQGYWKPEQYKALARADVLSLLG
jgi:hypothetical protein